MNPRRYLIWKAVWLSALVIGTISACTSALAAQRALLVGVSELVNQPRSVWLEAPRHDVQLMRQALLARGWSGADIVILADGVAGADLPDARRIQEALQLLLDQSESGDFVLLHFSGHGVRWRDPDKSYDEPDSLAEMFLTRDAQGRPGAASAPRGSLRDVEFDAWINAFQARNVFVWAVFDTCSATSMTRSARRPMAAGTQADGLDESDAVRFRGLRAEELLPGDAGTATSGVTSAPAVQRARQARYVAFFASESHQVTPELKLPRGSRNAQRHGLLTWAVVEALKQDPRSWRDVFDGVLSLYPPVIEDLERRFPARELPSPVVEGMLDAPIFTNPDVAQAAAPHWLARRAEGELILPAGELDGLQPGLAVLVTEQGANGRTRSAVTRVAATTLTGARVGLPTHLGATEAGTTWRVSPQETPPEAALRVAGDGHAAETLDVEFPASIEWVTDDVTDLRISRVPDGFRVSPVSEPQITLPGQQQLNRYLRSAARFKWLEQLVERTAAGRIEGFSVEMQVFTDGQLMRSRPLAGVEVRAPQAADVERLAVEVVNASGRSVDLLIVGADAEGQLYPVYPSSGAEANRFESGQRQRPSSKRFWLPVEITRPGGRLVVLATPARAMTSPRLFGVAFGSDLGDLRLRGVTPVAPEPAVHAAALRW